MFVNCKATPRHTLAEDRRNLAPPSLDLAAGVSGSRLVHRIVNGTAEVPDDPDRFPLLRRQDEKRVIEVGVPRHQGFPISVAAASAGMSRFPIVGRACNVS
jgi:hypothetical protein